MYFGCPQERHLRQIGCSLHHKQTIGTVCVSRTVQPHARCFAGGASEWDHVGTRPSELMHTSADTVGAQLLVLGYPVVPKHDIREVLGHVVQGQSITAPCLVCPSPALQEQGESILDVGPDHPQ